MISTSVQQQKETHYEALLSRDPEYVGLFFAAIRTTGIFCISTCRARKPKFKNVEFFKDAKSALQHRYRPCKVCKPTNSTFEPPVDIQQALNMLFESDITKVSDYELKQAGLSPEKIRRWFKANHGITFQAYQRMLRINTAFQDLKSGSKVAQAAFDSGYDSLSGFGYTFKVLTGKSPKETLNKQIIQLTKTDTPLGPMFIAATENGVCMLEFSDRRMLETEFRDLQLRLNAVILHGENEITKQTKRELSEYFEGQRKVFTIPIDSPGTDFQKTVWEVLQSIPYAGTRSYQEQAQLLGKPKAIRAVANANGCNRISIVIPCHRVIGKDGSLTGYGGGLERKKWLLDFEISNRD
ncbi:MAG: methylated-DNA--[protein]-cysteine S-methyltransferase [Balneolaceae bacterium]|nr:methylated-DNA--[protein]-cysteine S-methyltransferase [Balneolaceae bacterium]